MTPSGPGASLAPLIATDLDRTMIYSAGAAGAGIDDAVCVELYRGAPLSYMTARATVLLAELARSAVVLPTTTRTVEQFRRIELPGAPWRYAVTSNGGHILVDGVPDAEWHNRILADTGAGGATLSEVAAELAARIDDSWVNAFRTADDLFCYLVVEPDAVPSGFVEEWSDWCNRLGWNVSRQGRKIYTMPDTVCKSRAVAEVRARLITTGTLSADAPLLAAGDGALDAELLSSADHAIRPRHGELHELGWTHPNLTITTHTGIHAGEEILTRLHRL